MTIMIKAEPDAPSVITSDMDRIWFKQNPGRFLNLRRPTDGDGAPVCLGEILPRIFPNGAFVLVFCPTDGIRWRLPGSFDPESMGMRWLHGAPHADSDLIPIAESILDALPRSWDSFGTDFKTALSDCAKCGGRLDDLRALPRSLRLDQ